MKDFLKITLLQTNIEWNNKLKNLYVYENLLKHIEKTDLALFPELFDTGFVTDVNILNKSQNELAVNWLTHNAKEHNFSIGATSLYHENHKYFNRFLFAKPDATIEHYDKKHLFSIAGEDQYISHGNQRKIVSIDTWKINILTCYDLRFPVWSRNKNDYDVLVYLANWPDSRIKQWKILLAARAIENQSYVVGVNRIGTDEHGFKYPGKSLVINPKGKIIFEGKENEQDIATIELDYNYLQKLRNNFPVLRDADKFSLH